MARRANGHKMKRREPEQKDAFETMELSMSSFGNAKHQGVFHDGIC
jgi:hypothetical protein